MPMEAEADRVPPVMPPTMISPSMSDVYAKDTLLAWFRGEFAAANAIIDVLCSHLAQLGESGSEYDSVFSEIHKRRMNWIPVLQMQKYHSITDVTIELHQMVAKKLEQEKKKSVEKTKDAVDEVIAVEANGGDRHDCCDDADQDEDSPHSEITDSGSHEVQSSTENVDICSNHENCEGRTAQIKSTKSFTAKEQVKGHNMNIVKGLKLYENIFTESELSKLTDFVNELRLAGQKRELLGETFILFNKEVKGNRREMIQLGVPIFGQVKENATSNNQTGFIEPIPALLRGVINHLIQWNLIPKYKRPNGCIISFFDEGEYSQPFLKPPHLDQPIVTLLLSNSTMAFGHKLISDNNGNYKGQLMLSLNEGSLLVMRGNSADIARHVICPSPNRRISIIFFRTRPEPVPALVPDQEYSPPTTPVAGSMTLWQPSVTTPNEDAMSQWGIMPAPMIILPPMGPVMLSPKIIPNNGGTGVFLPWTTVSSRKPVKHLPPRAQKGRHP